MRTTLNISLPEEMRTWVDEQIAQGGYGTISEFFRQLVREEQKRRIRDQIEAKLLANLESGEPIKVTPEFWEDRRRELERRIKKKSAAK
ncbi:MAG TPA: type II toxin-antitoxin system ParD family antitoxin [Phycisphaerae bacterium]|nr:type II toxin-antitoxin system ParD family antitoxin [Phycisphaerae bacterium]